MSSPQPITFPLTSQRLPALKGWNLLEESVPHEEGSNFAMLTGKTPGIFVVDVDMKNGKNGVAALSVLGNLPDTLTVKTRSGGYHFYFIHPGGEIPTTAGKIAEGVDIRGDKNGYVVGPGSPGYEIIDDRDPVDAPTWLLERIGQVRDATPTTSDTPGVIPIDEEHADYARRLELARTFLQEDALPAIEGHDGSAVTLRAASYLTVKLQLPVDVAYGLMLHHYNPRCQPAWNGKDLHRKVTEAARNSLGLSTGIPSEGFSLSPPKPETAITAPTRRVHNPEHQYTFETGQPPNGKSYKATVAEVVADLCQCPDWAGVLQYDEFGDRLVAVDPPMKLDAETSSITDQDLIAIRCWFEVVGGKLVSQDTMCAAVDSAARALTFHPVQDYLMGLPVEPAGYLEEFVQHVFGEVQPVQVEFVKKALVSAVKRVFEPGCFVKSMLVLTGEQNAGKSSLCKRLFGQWFKEDISDLKNKDAVQELLGVWGLEMAEMDSISRAEIKTVKSFVSRAVDIFRPSYGRKAITRGRQNIFIGTTNEEEMLRDASGGTRFWPIEVPDTIPLDWDRNRVWSAAYQLYLSGYSVYLDNAELIKQADAVREKHNYVDAWTETVERHLATRDRVSANQVLALVLPEAGHRDGKSQARVQAILRRLCGNSYRKGDDKTRWYKVPERLKTSLKVIK